MNQSARWWAWEAGPLLKIMLFIAALPENAAARSAFEQLSQAVCGEMEEFRVAWNRFIDHPLRHRLAQQFARNVTLDLPPRLRRQSASGVCPFM